MKRWNDPVFPGCDLVDIAPGSGTWTTSGSMRRSCTLFVVVAVPDVEPGGRSCHAPELQPVGRGAAPPRAGGRLRWATVMVPPAQWSEPSRSSSSPRGAARRRCSCSGQNHGHEPRRPEDVPAVRASPGVRPPDHRARRQRPGASRRDPGNAHARRAHGPARCVLRRRVGRPHPAGSRGFVGPSWREAPAGWLKSLRRDVPGRRHSARTAAQGLARLGAGGPRAARSSLVACAGRR